MVFPLSAEVLLAIPLAPLMGAIIAGLFGTSFLGYRISRQAVHTITILGVAIAFVLSLLSLLAVMRGQSYNGTIYTWMMLAEMPFTMGFLIDGLTALMMCIVTFVSLMVHVYTMGYMKDDPGYNRFFAYLSVFTFAMLMLVMSNNFLQLFFGWEAVGLVSYLLIGFWYTKPTAIFANMKAFIVNRIGDFGFILGIGLLFAYTGSMDYTDVFEKNQLLSQYPFPGTDWRLLTVICICLFIGAMGKSAQFPLHVWLPDSMEGPTPISALIHAATMVTAGIFMVARMSPLFELSDTALSFILIIGAITALFMGFLGIIQNDIKRIIAYSTLSQLGYMTVALGASAYSVAIFHLMTHAFFKALLFLAAGSVIMGMHHEQDIRKMGGLSHYMPITWITSLIGSLALIGTPFFSGFYSKDSIIEAVRESTLPGAGFAYFAVLMGVFVTAFYAFRMVFLVFHGQERFHQSNHTQRHHHSSTPHESPPVITGPLIVLAIASLIMGFITIGPLLFTDFFDKAIMVDKTHVSMGVLNVAFSGSVAMALHSIMTWPFWLAVAGVLMAYWLYLCSPHIPEKIQSVCWPFYTLLENKYYIDKFNQAILAKSVLVIGKGFWRWGDRGLIDGVVVNGCARLVQKIAQWIHGRVSGYIYHYAFVMIVGVLGLLIWWIPFWKA